MRSQVLDPDAAEAIATIDDAIADLLATGAAPADSRDAIVWIRELEGLTRRLDATKAELCTAIETRGLHRHDGHGSPAVMIRHVAQLSGAEAAGRAKTARLVKDLPEVAAAYRTGTIGTDQVRLLGRVHANPRVRAHMPERQAAFVEQAAALDYRGFEIVVRQWERLMDFDGTCDRNQHNHQRRDASLLQDPFDLSWTLSGSFGSWQGMAMRQIFDHYIDAELRADWEKARAEHGDNATVAHLARTDAQRRADAVWQLFCDAASTSPDATTPTVVHNIVWDAATYTQLLATITEPGHRPNLDPATYRCGTLDGTPVEPVEAATNSLVADPTAPRSNEPIGTALSDFR